MITKLSNGSKTDGGMSKAITARSLKAYCERIQPSIEELEGIKDRVLNCIKRSAQIPGNNTDAWWEEFLLLVDFAVRRIKRIAKLGRIHIKDAACLNKGISVLDKWNYLRKLANTKPMKALKRVYRITDAVLTCETPYYTAEEDYKRVKEALTSYSCYWVMVLGPVYLFH